MRDTQRRAYDSRMTNSTFRIVPLAREVAEEARRRAKEGQSDHVAVEVEAPHTAPCRHCLRWAEPGERVVLFPFPSVPAGRPYSETGPIFVHEHACARYERPNEYPAGFREGRVLRAYDTNCNMIDAVVVNGTPPEDVIAELFANPNTAFLQARSLTRGCFTFRIERAENA